MISGFSAVEREFEHDTVEQARNSAYEFAASTGGRVYPCVVFRQGERIMLSTSFPFTFIARQVRFDSAMKGENPRGATNRPLIADHVKNIREYLLNNRKEYILPPVTLNVRQMPQVHVAKGNAAVRSGYLVVDDSTLYYVTDGQHRIAAIAGHKVSKPMITGVLDENPDFGSDSLSVLIVVEPDIDQIHQDFADAAQTKQIPPSLLAAYNMREPVNRVLTKVIDASELLKGRVDETSSKLPKFSQAMFLLNQVRGLIKELLVSDYAMSDDTLSKHAAHYVGTQVQQDAFVRQTLQLLEVLTKSMDPWNQIVKYPMTGGASNKIPDFRAQYVNMTATGLVIIGRVAFEINKLEDEADRLSKYAELGTLIDWRRDADIWQNTIVTEGKLLTNRAPVSEAAAAVKRTLGLA